MQTINSDSGNRKFYVIHFIYFSSMETDINFFTCIFLAWELVVYYLGGGGILPGGSL